MQRLVIFFALAFFTACGSKSSSGPNTPPPQSMVADEVADDGKGIGEVREVSLNTPLKQDMVDKGKAIYEMKCAACHKLSDQRVVGPGWKGVTERRKPEWIMNMATNVDIMLEKDPAAQELLKQCLVRMPNQNLTVGDARDVLEFMYANDGHEAGQ
ncbi:MAG: cytochrome c [Lewinellaceae bacterium]|nr:cytochrome c [Lewinellaceae bacterium]